MGICNDTRYSQYLMKHLRESFDEWWVFKRWDCFILMKDFEGIVSNKSLGILLCLWKVSDQLYCRKS